MYTKAAIISALAGLAAAAPTPRDSTQNIFSGVTLHSTSPIQGAAIQANGQSFYVNKDASTYCPGGVVDCSSVGNSTTVFAYGTTTQGLSLDVTVPGGQQIFVRADGSLGFTVAHSSVIPSGAYTSPFQYTPQAGEGRVGELLFENQGFNACPTGEQGPVGGDVYQIYAAAVPSDKQTSDCISATFGTSEWDGAIAWEYV